MRIDRVDTEIIQQPWDTGGRTQNIGGGDWSSLSVLMVKVVTDQGVTGVGEAFSYNCLDAVKAAVETMIAPRITGREVNDIREFNTGLQQELHLFGRYGITLFALSGIDIALWDAKSKIEGRPLYELLGGAKRKTITAYASFFRYGDHHVVEKVCKQAIDEGYTHFKLHELDHACIDAARKTIGNDAPLMLDLNCPWRADSAIDNVSKLKPFSPYWVEEPVFPPEDFRALAHCREQTGLRLAAGENACTAEEFRKMMDAQAVDYVQPSVTKVGGISEFLGVLELADARGVSVMPHSPYFGPGLLATLHLSLSMQQTPLLERFYGRIDNSPCGDLINPVDGQFTLAAVDDFEGM